MTQYLIQGTTPLRNWENAQRDLLFAIAAALLDEEKVKSILDKNKVHYAILLPRGEKNDRRDN